MKFAGRFIDLLGHQMYGGAVPAIVEFVANAWDADAKKVEITVPETSRAQDAEIKVRDYGEGMTFDELNNYYLNIGYERRKRGEKTKSGRLVMGRKGIGKLAGFGIAEDIILRSIKKGHLIQFDLNYSDLKSKNELKDFEFNPDKDEKSKEKTGVTVILRNLKLKRKIDVDEFRKSLSRRFALNTDDMKIIINGKPLTKENMEFEYRIPDGDSWKKENITGFGRVEYWFGFLKETIKDKELRGISIFARGRVAQFTPFHFNLSGGINGQVGLEYLTGQVKAEGLDKHMDYVATPRSSVNWQFGKATILENWGQDKIKELCKNWKKRKDEKNLANFKHNYSEFFPIIHALPAQEQKDLISALEKIAGLERIEEDDFKIIAKSMISGVERESVKKVIRRINTASENSLEELIEAVKEWDIIAAVSTAEVIAGKIEIINQFSKYIEDRLPEKKGRGHLDMQTFIRDHPWLLGHEYEHLQPADFHHEHGIDKWINEVLKKADKEYSHKDRNDGKRFDLVCIKNEHNIAVIELMRPGMPVDYDHVTRLNLYVTRIEDAIKSKGTQEKFKNKSVFGVLIADSIKNDPTVRASLDQFRNTLEAIDWAGLFENVQARYKDFFDFLKLKAPEDPRIKGLVSLD